MIHPFLIVVSSKCLGKMNIVDIKLVFIAHITVILTCSAVSSSSDLLEIDDIVVVDVFIVKSVSKW